MLALRIKNTKLLTHGQFHFLIIPTPILYHKYYCYNSNDGKRYWQDARGWFQKLGNRRNICIHKNIEKRCWSNPILFVFYFWNTVSYCMDIWYSFSNRAWYVRHVDFLKNEENNNGISWVNLSVLSELIFFPRYFYQKLFNRPSQKVIYFTTFDVISAPITIEYCVIWSSGCNNIINIIDVT